MKYYKCINCMHLEKCVSCKDGNMYEPINVMGIGDGVNSHIINVASMHPTLKQYETVEITKVIVNHPAVIVFWTDGTKTVVKCGDDDIFDPEKGLAMAISKKVLGNKGNYYNEFRKWLSD